MLRYEIQQSDLRRLVAAFADTDVKVMNIGDSNVRARRIIEGTHEGRNFVKILKKRWIF